MDGRVACSRDLNGLLHCPGDAVAVDIRHSKDMNVMHT
jgi:hypothetical protein